MGKLQNVTDQDMFKTLVMGLFELLLQLIAAQVPGVVAPVHACENAEGAQCCSSKLCCRPRASSERLGNERRRFENMSKSAQSCFVAGKRPWIVCAPTKRRDCVARVHAPSACLKCAPEGVPRVRAQVARPERMPRVAPNLCWCLRMWGG